MQKFFRVIGAGILSAAILSVSHGQALPDPLAPVTHPVNPGRIPESSFPGLLINPDLRSAAMGDGGVGMRPTGNAAALYLNPARMVDQPYQSAISVSYTPWLRNIIDGQAVMNASYYRHMGKNEAIGFTATYFDMGSVKLTDNQGYSIGTLRAGDIYLSANYARRLSQRLALAVTVGYANSNLGTALSSTASANAVNASISLWHNARDTTNTDRYNRDTTRRGQFSYGISLNNIGGKTSYNNSRELNYQPTNLRAGIAWNRKLTSDGVHQLTASFDVMKMLVPTPPIRNYRGAVLSGSDPATTSALGALVSSWSDAPDGIGEEIKEIMWSLGAEYRYRSILAARLGYFHESNMKGGRMNLTMGLGVTVNNRLSLDGAFLIPVAQVGSPLASTWRLGLHYVFKKSIGKRDTQYPADDDQINDMTPAR